MANNNLHNRINAIQLENTNAPTAYSRKNYNTKVKELVAKQKRLIQILFSTNRNSNIDLKPYFNKLATNMTKLYEKRPTLKNRSLNNPARKHSGGRKHRTHRRKRV
jgi:hypothetical protein